jgi:hypothetical protein
LPSKYRRWCLLRVLPDFHQHELVPASRERVVVDERRAFRILSTGADPDRREVRLLGSAGFEEVVRMRREIGVDSRQPANRLDRFWLEGQRRASPSGLSRSLRDERTCTQRSSSWVTAAQTRAFATGDQIELAVSLAITVPAHARPSLPPLILTLRPCRSSGHCGGTGLEMVSGRRPHSCSPRCSWVPQQTSAPRVIAQVEPARIGEAMGFSVA